MGEVSRLSSKFAHALESIGVNSEDRVAIMLDPSWEYYVRLFGTMKRGAIAVLCLPQFGPEAIGYRLKDSAAKDVAVYQYTTRTTRKFPEAVKHYHCSIVTLLLVAIFGRGFRPGDRYFCPSHPAWRHGLWHGTLSPLVLGIVVGADSGKFDGENFLTGLEGFEIDNLGGTNGLSPH